MTSVLGFLIRFFSNYYTLHRSDLAARAAPLYPRLYTVKSILLCAMFDIIDHDYDVCKIKHMKKSLLKEFGIIMLFPCMVKHTLLNTLNMFDKLNYHYNP